MTATPPCPAAFAAAASRSASSRNASVISAHTAEEIICVAGVAAPDWPSAFAVALAVVAGHSTLRIGSRHPAGERPVPKVVRRFEEHRLPEPVVAAVARDPDVSHAAAAPGRLPGRLAEARRPADLRLARPQLVTERAGLRLVLEQRNGHLNDHAQTSCHESMIIVTCTDDRAGRAPGRPGTWPGWPCALVLGAGQPRPILGEADPGHRLHRRRHWFRRLRLTGNRAAGGERAARGSSPASVGPASEGRERS